MKLLLVDDDAAVRRALRRLLAAADVELDEAESVEAALAAIEAGQPDLLVLDVALGPAGVEGLDLLRELRSIGRAIPTVMVTSSRDMEHVREAMRLGASDYVFKDELSPELFLPIVDGYRERLELGREVVRLRSQIDRSFGVSALVGRSSAMERVRKLVVRLADADSTVLVLGETGTGKDLVARALHHQARRRDEPFLAVNCSAMPGPHIESMLFGHERGAFYGADRRVRGYFDLAGAGTLFLDEIAELPVDLQAKLLRVVEDRTYRPLGAEHEVPLRARLVAATVADLEARVAAKTFRDDLYHRLNVVRIELPTLADRGDDILDLVAAFVEASERPLRFTDRALEWLRGRSWSGNVRELRNVIERLVLLVDGDLVDVDALEELVPAPRAHSPSGEDHSLEHFASLVLASPQRGTASRLELAELALVRAAIDRSGGNVSAAARLLGVPRSMMRRRLEEVRRVSASGSVPPPPRR